jgi:hypothetical protein
VRNLYLAETLFCVTVKLVSSSIHWNRIGDVLVSSTDDRGFEPWSGQTKDYTIGMCCFSAKHATLFVSSKELEGRSINYHKRDIKMNHSELWNVVKIITL